MNLQSALLGYYCSAAHICKDSICTRTSVYSTSEVTCTAGAEYLAFSSLIGAFLHPDDFMVENI
jgi:hypothetical protein